MSPAEARERVRKLAEVRVDRGATVAEERVARVKAERLIRQYRLDRDPVAAAPRRARPAAPPRAPQWRRGAFVPPVYSGEPWSFDTRTGKASANVRVHHYRGPSNWKITVPR